MAKNANSRSQHLLLINEVCQCCNRSPSQFESVDLSKNLKGFKINIDYAPIVQWSRTLPSQMRWFFLHKRIKSCISMRTSSKFLEYGGNPSSNLGRGVYGFVRSIFHWGSLFISNPRVLLLTIFSFISKVKLEFGSRILFFKISFLVKTHSVFAKN